MKRAGILPHGRGAIIVRFGHPYTERIVNTLKRRRRQACRVIERDASDERKKLC
jgi:hypothetical protein